MRRMPNRIGLRCDEAGRNCQPFSDADDEKPWSRLWHEVHRVNDECAKAVFPPDDCGADRRKILSFMRGESAANIFENDKRGRAAFLAELSHEAPERPESPRTFAVQTRPGACQRQILTRERGPGEIGRAGQVFRS